MRGEATHTVGADAVTMLQIIPSVQVQLSCLEQHFYLHVRLLADLESLALSPRIRFIYWIVRIITLRCGDNTPPRAPEPLRVQ